MTPFNPHALNASLLALPAAVAFTRQLLRHRKMAVLAATESPVDLKNQVERHSKTMTETLKSIVGYHHHGIND